jgi:hypothetical protein
MISAVTPHCFHRLMANRLRNIGPDAHAPYPTFYRMNCRRTIRSILGGAGFSELELILIEKEPSYGMSCRLLFLSFMAYERLVNSSELLAMFRANLLGAFRKPAISPDPSRAK